MSSMCNSLVSEDIWMLIEMSTETVSDSIEIVETEDMFEVVVCQWFVRGTVGNTGCIHLPLFTAFCMIDSSTRTVPHESHCVITRLASVQEEENIILIDGIEIAESVLAFFIRVDLTGTTLLELLIAHSFRIG